MNLTHEGALPLRLVSCVKSNRRCLLSCWYWSTDQCSTFNEHDTEPSYHGDSVHLAFSMVSFYRCSTDVFGEGLRQLPLAGIALERTRGPEGVGRVYPYGLGGFLHFGLDVRVDLRGRGRQLCPCHGSAPSSAAANRFFLPSVSEQPGSFTDPQRRRLTHLPRLTGAVPRRGGRACFPAASRGVGSRCRAILHPWWRNRGSVRLRRFARRHDYTSTAPPTGFTMRLYNRGQIFGFYLHRSENREIFRDDSEKPNGSSHFLLNLSRSVLNEV